MDVGTLSNHVKFVCVFSFFLLRFYDHFFTNHNNWYDSVGYDGYDLPCEHNEIRWIRELRIVAEEG